MTQEVKVLFGIGLATLLILVVGVFFLNRTQSVEEEPVEEADVEFLLREDSYKVGSPSASVTLVEFGDFQCPACASAFPVVKSVLSEYDEKDIQFVFRHFPLPMHKNAQLAAIVAEAAGRQGKFWDMHDVLYANQTEWEGSNTPIEIFNQYATDLELDLDQFAADVKDGELADKIRRDQTDGGVLGVNSTPTFFLNGMPIRGVPTLEDLKVRIDEALL